MSRNSNEKERISSGIAELDRILGGGFPSGTLCCIQGDIGTGTTTFCAQVVWSRLVSGGLGAYVCLDEAPDRVAEQFKSFGCDLTPYIQKGVFMFQDGHPLMNSLASAVQGQNGVVERRTLLSRFVAEYNEKTYAARKLSTSNRLPTVSVVDSFSSIAPYIDLKSVYVLAQMIANFTRRHGDLVLSVVHTGPIEANVLCACNVSADGLVRLERSVARGVLRRYIRIEKMAFTPTPAKMLEYQITGEHGLQLVNGLSLANGRVRSARV